MNHLISKMGVRTMGKNFYISDLHIGHANVIKFDNRPFKDVDEMFEILVRNWNSVVTKEDTVYILGDFIWRKGPEWPSIINKFCGKKVLIKGNHDLKEYSANIKSFFQDIKDYKEITDEGKHVVMCHYPIPFHKAAYNSDCYMLYGHVHITKEWAYMEDIKKMIRANYKARGDNRGNWYNVGCMMPYMNYTPRTLDEIIASDKSERGIVEC